VRSPRSKVSKSSRKKRARSRRNVSLRAFSFKAVTPDSPDPERRHALQFTERLGKRTTLHMVQVGGGAFLMGAPESEPGSQSSEHPPHHVAVPSFYLGKHAVTIAQWRAVMRAFPYAMKFVDDSFKRSDRQPVVRVSYDEVEEFCARLSRKTRRAYRLPTEAEWEYACRAGASTAFAFGATISRELAVHDGVTIRRADPDGTHATTRAVGGLGIANAFGLFDMHGNVWEWCQDWWHGTYQGAPVDGSAWCSAGAAPTRLLRGGSWYSEAAFCRSASRSFGGEAGIRSRQIGFRLALTSGAD
jgi:formylglycine-generating enzyme required for sulfatase activity